MLLKDMGHLHPIKEKEFQEFGIKIYLRNFDFVYLLFISNIYHFVHYKRNPQ
jgi:hypothetical protein